MFPAGGSGQNVDNQVTSPAVKCGELHSTTFGTQKPGISRTSITNQTLQTVSRTLSSQLLLSINIIEQSSSQFIVKGIVTIKQHNIYIHNLQSRVRRTSQSEHFCYEIQLKTRWSCFRVKLQQTGNCQDLQLQLDMGLLKLDIRHQTQDMGHRILEY